MAGIGFVFKKLLEQDNFSGKVRAYFHAAISTSGPWIITVIALSFFYMIAQSVPLMEEMEIFRTVVLYNFCFSFVMTAPLINVATRYLSDRFYEGDFKPVSSLSLGVFIVVAVMGTLLSSSFYYFLTPISWKIGLQAVMNFALISSIWSLATFISALKYYQSVSYSFLLGMIIGVTLAILFSRSLGAEGMLLGINIGIGIILSSLIALICAEYPQAVRPPIAFLKGFVEYYQLALGGLIYSVSVWIDKWIMWTAPEAIVTSLNLPLFPEYDSAMFLAYMTVIPAVAYFSISYETSFYEVYVRFYHGILQHSNLKKMEQDRNVLVCCTLEKGKNVVIIQGVMAFLTFIIAPLIFDSLPGLRIIQLALFRYGVLGAAFHALTLFIVVLLCYFDERRLSLKIQTLFLVTNALFTYTILQWGYVYYGMGYFLANIVTFTYAAVVFEEYLSDLHYHAFVTTNHSLEK